MGRPVFLSENVFNRRIFPSHTLTSSSTESGLDVASVGTGRRQRSLNRWAPSGTNAAAYVGCQFDRVRAFNFLASDRGHNLTGHEVSLRISDDGFSTYQELGPYTWPSQSYPFARLSDARPVLTEEGAVVWWLGRIYAASEVRFYVPAMGTGLKPEVVGLYLGSWFRPEHAAVKPVSYGEIETLYHEERSPQGIVAAGEVAKRRRGQVHLKLANRTEYELVRYHIEDLFYSRKPMWLVPDDEEAEKSFLVYKPPGTARFAVEDDWSEFQGRIPYIEHEPERVS